MKLINTISKSSTFLILVFSCASFLFTLFILTHELFEHSSLVGKNPAYQDLVMIMVGISVSGILMMILFLWSFLKLRHEGKIKNSIYQKLQTQMAAIESSRDGIAILDSEGLYTYMSPSHALCYGYQSTQDMMGKSWKDLYEDEERLRFEVEVFPSLYTQSWWIGYAIGKKADGSLFPQEVSLNLLDDGGMICIVRDVSDKIEKEKRLRMVNLAIEAANDGIAITDSTNKILFMNQSFLRIHGLDSADMEGLIGSDWRDIYNASGREQINRVVLPSAILKGAWSGSMKVMKKNGDIFYGDASLTKLKDGLFLGVMRDISERKRVEQEGEALREEVENTRKMEAIARLTDAITTDFSKIINVILDEAAKLQKSTEGNVHDQQSVRRIVEASAKAADLVDQLLSFRHKKNVRAKLLDLAEAIRVLQSKLQESLEGSRACNVVIAVKDSMIYANPSQVTQTLNSLCQNAIEATKQETGRFIISLKDADKSYMGLKNHLIAEETPTRFQASLVRRANLKQKDCVVSGYLQPNEEHLHLTVSDNGTGIPPEILLNIFDPFFTTKRNMPGAGLGLSAVQGSVITAGGAIVVETAKDKGTDVHIFLQKARAKEHQELPSEIATI